MVDALAQLFPGLQRGEYQRTSPPTRAYNCIAWAAGDTRRWWWPNDDPDDDARHWPDGIPREETMAAFLAVFALLGYVPCDEAAAEERVEKVALFATADGVPTHAARQLQNGRWTSKLGELDDIEHDLQDVSGDLYGTVVRVLKRSRPPES
jgi:hypothetical protein